MPSFLPEVMTEELKKLFPLLWLQLPLDIGKTWLAAEASIPNINNPLESVRMWVDAEIIAPKDFYITDKDTNYKSCPGVKLYFFYPMEQIESDTIFEEDSLIIVSDTTMVPTKVFMLETYFAEGVGPVSNISYVDLTAFGIPFGGAETPIRTESLVDFTLIKED